MPQIAVSENPALAADMLRQLDEKEKAARTEPPPLRTPEQTVFPLCGGYLQNDGTWATEFEVRELTGRDEEALGRLNDAARLFIGLLERGLVRVGNDKVTPSVIDGLLSGDWDTVIMAVRMVNFGPEVESFWTCTSCGKEFATMHDLSEIKRKTVDRSRLRFTVKGRRTTYEVEHPYGATQRKILLKPDITAAEMNSIMLADCIQAIGNRPSMGMEEIRNLSMADRRTLIKEIDAHRAGPLLGEVRSECPFCGTEQNTPLNATALFR